MRDGLALTAVHIKYLKIKKGTREMNALQIADELDGRLDHVAANMLRQQQAVIEMLEAELKAMREQLNANQV